MSKAKRSNVLCEIAGWYGVIAIIVAYFLISFSIVRPDSLVYQVLNLTGAVGIIAISLYRRQKQTAVLNIFWASIAILAILNLLLN